MTNNVPSITVEELCNNTATTNIWFGVFAGVRGHRGDLSPSPLDAQRNAVRVSQMMSQNGPTDNTNTQTKT
eukprot:12869048-Heterocapsa_arctica.AAC.1